MQQAAAAGGRGGPGSRKPYKTTINTATDNIQYRGQYARPKGQGPPPPGGPDGEHYKVPRNKTPVDPAFFRRSEGGAYNGDSDQSSSVMGGYHPYKTYGGRGSSQGPTGFNSARLVKNAGESASRRHSAAVPMSGGHHGSSRELDREGRMIR